MNWNIHIKLVGKMRSIFSHCQDTGENLVSSVERVRLMMGWTNKRNGKRIWEEGWKEIKV
jgi:hypothetical protein